MVAVDWVNWLIEFASLLASATNSAADFPSLFVNAMTEMNFIVS